MDIWNDPDDEIPTANADTPMTDNESPTASTVGLGSPPVSSDSSNSSELRPPLRKSPLTQDQIDRIALYILCSEYVSATENKIVDIQVHIGRECDQPGAKGLKKDLAKAQSTLHKLKEEKKRNVCALSQEQERLKKSVGEGAELAKKQLKEIDVYLERVKTRPCLR
ncbi:hypothetical protein PtrSN002B_009192 [Pyrenophora tritici-repentis]|uniref:Uncharacterized protein n=2 Tax=Pyrenophora tritici-repentis TaxID=45151 RepID=A0A2W1CWN9_9PLEO|nr:uncharacterized protein PTRG_03162 [Pyrenophora tritici-repentis Pt-1C-BFP]KAA8622744.1 hypothetical protein PtrV1_04050 [Pyrenophora tritici-repentis]EDU45685.1 predicted protein [Pyrenophora tritici-repentis Pt-1C-BFP]KAF7451728.1 hypothetical protein A1F99_035050 [Pyrenophora tritici-repentis]KAF7575155.1 hypothetical protein PtrM4_067790 [Pyrenophora tritici-repentis]KAG9386085.1 hypothetical protein A1F94_002835 [Pyrenophora tritici-repentis]